jgi:D-alanine-D-alanine ligase
LAGTSVSAKTPPLETTGCCTVEKENIVKEPTKTMNTEAKPQGPQLDHSIAGRVRYFFTSILGFFTSPVFFKNCLAIVLFIAVVFLGFTWWLNIYTYHGKTRTIGDYVGMNLDQASKTAQRNTFQIIINDSIFVVGKDPNVILDQTPKPNAKVKKNRSVYVTVTSNTPPLVPLPKLIGNYDYSQYTRKLERLGINFRIRERKFDYKQEPNTILYFYHGEEQITDSKLRRGVKVPKGSLLEFVVTERNTGQVYIPNLVCKRFKAATFMIEGMDLLIDDVFGPRRDDAYVERQEPAYQAGAMIPVGSRITLYLSNERPLGCSEGNEPSDLVVPQDTTSEEGN